MENQRSSSPVKGFVKKIMVLEICVFLIAGVLAFFLSLHFAVILLGVGILSSVVGSYLGNAYPYSHKNPAMSNSIPYERRPVEKNRARILYYVKHSVPLYSSENALVFAGVIAILLALLFLFL
jgi:hypothetical protein